MVWINDLLSEMKPVYAVIRAIDMDTRLEMLSNYLLNRHSTTGVQNQYIINAPTLQQQVNILISQTQQEEKNTSPTPRHCGEVPASPGTQKAISRNTDCPPAQDEQNTEKATLLSLGGDIGKNTKGIAADRGGSPAQGKQPTVNSARSHPVHLTKLNRLARKTPRILRHPPRKSRSPGALLTVKPIIT